MPSVVINDGYPLPSPWVPNNSASKWIAPQANQHVNGGDSHGTYVYRTTFSLSGLQPATASINGEWAADDVGSDILINGVSITPTNPGFATLTPFTVSSGFVSGTNTLDFVVINKSLGGSADMNPTGLRVVLSGQAVPAPEPSPAIILGMGVMGLSFLALHVRRRAAAH